MEKTFEILVNATAEMIKNAPNSQEMFNDFVDCLKFKYERMRIFDADGTFKANNGSFEHPLLMGSSDGLECLQVITQKCLDLRLTEDINDLEWDAFYKHCRDIWFKFCEKYVTTDFSKIGAGMWEVAELFAEKKFGRL